MCGGGYDELGLWVFVRVANWVCFGGGWVQRMEGGGGNGACVDGEVWNFIMFESGQKCVCMICKLVC